MRKSWVKVSLVCASALAVIGSASAQSVSFWFNSLGDAVTSQPTDINVFSGQDATFSVYLKTTNVGALTSISVLFGYSTSTDQGQSATPADTKASFVSRTWAQSEFTSGEILSTTAGGGGVASGTSRPWGYAGQTVTFSQFPGTGDGVNLHVIDIKLHINAAAGNDIPINVWTANTDEFTSNVFDVSGNRISPASPYTATLHVVPVPEPTTMAALGIGAIALIRRRKRSR